MPFSLPVVELWEVAEPERRPSYARWRGRRYSDLLTLTQGPLLRATLVRLADTEYVLLLSMHHIVFDG